MALRRHLWRRESQTCPMVLAEKATIVLAVLLPVLGASDSRGADTQATCAMCHPSEAEELGRSVHAAFDCRECHGGRESYNLSVEKARERSGEPGSGATGAVFDHGAEFRGKPTRAAVPEACGLCHADVERMNPYGLRTDQLARYWTSGHGKSLAKEGEHRVAVCTDCHGTHSVLPAKDPASRTYPLNVPDMCATCHANQTLMTEFGLPFEQVEEYRQSVHGKLLLEESDTGAPTCATCHGNHSAMPPGFATVDAVCGQCHQHAAKEFAASVHAEEDGFRGCVQCHGGGEGKYDHLIERITKPTGILIQRYAHLLESEPAASAQQGLEAIQQTPKRIMESALPTCLECHDEIDEDESLPKLFSLIDSIAEGERSYVRTAERLDRVGRGVLLVDRQRFVFEDAKTHLIELSPLQHALDKEKVAAKVAELNEVCDQVNTELDELERGLRWRRGALIPIWIFSVLFAIALYAKYKQLKAIYVEPTPTGSAGH